MSQRMALVLALGLTAFILVVTTGVGVSVALRSISVDQAVQAAPAVNSAAPAELSVSATGQAALLKTNLSADQAAQIAIKAVPGAVLTRTPELVSLQGTVAFEVLLNQGTVYVDANTGKVLVNSTTQFAGLPRSGGERQHEGEQHEGFEGGHDD